VVGHVGQTREHIAQIGVGVQAAPAAALDNGVDDGTPLTGTGFGFVKIFV
jgi:hypothetical protein